MENIFNQAVHAYIADEFRQAADFFTKVIDNDNNDINSRFYRASAYIKLGQFEDAISDLTNFLTNLNNIYYKINFMYTFLILYINYYNLTFYVY